MKRAVGNIFDAQHGVICHQVNCMGVMGAGIAKQVRLRFPNAYQDYVQLVRSWGSHECLGKCQLIEVVQKTLYVANLFGQYRYGRDKRYTDYGALSSSLASLAHWHKTNCHPNFPIFIPYKMGCSLAGGDWNEVEAIIEAQIPNAIIVRMK